MKNIGSLIFIVCLFAFSNIPINVLKAQKQSLDPSFLDNGKTVDSLKKKYDCEAITYNNWDKKVTDSCLTVCLINSTNVPLGIEAGDQFKNIASAIKKVLINPKSYKSIYIIFVKKESFHGKELRTHTSGMEVLTSEL